MSKALRNRWLHNTCWLLVYLVLAYLLLMPLMTHAGNHLPDDGDSLLGLWINWWGANHLAMGYPGILDANAYYPHAGGLIYSEPMLTQALMTWPLFRVLDNSVLVANLLTLMTLALSAFGAHLLLRELTGSDIAAAVGAVYYAFGCFNLSQIPRVQLISLQWLPLALLSLHRFFFEDKKAYLFGFVVFSVLHGFACFYYLAFYGIILAFLVPVYFWTCRCWEKRLSTIFLIAAGLFLGIVFLWATYPYLSLYRRYGFTGSAATFDLIRFFQPTSGSVLYGAWASRPYLVDHFLGFVALLLAALGLVVSARSRAKSRAVVLAYAALGALGFLLSGGPELVFNGYHLAPSPYQILQKIGPFANLRDPERFSVLTRAALSILLAQAAAVILVRFRPTRRVWVGMVLALVLLAEQWSPRYAHGTEIPTGPKVPEVYYWLATHPGREPLAELPVLPFRLVRFNTLDAYFSTFHRRPILFNKPSFYPPATEILRWELRKFPDPTSTTLLRALGVRTAVIHPKRWGNLRQRRRHLKALKASSTEFSLLGKFPNREDPLWARYNLGGERLYLIAPLSHHGSPRPCDCREIDRAEYELAASGSNDPKSAVDGDRRTKWTTGKSQRKGYYLEIQFDRPRRPVRIEIEMAYPYEEFARNLEVNGYLGQRMWRIRQIEDVWYKVALIRQLVEAPSKARLRYDLEPATVDRLRLLIHRTERGTHPWSISEIHVFQEADGK